MGLFGNKSDRDTFRDELVKLGEISRRDEKAGGYESDEFLEQNRKVAAAEKKAGFLGSLIVRADVD